MRSADVLAAVLDSLESRDVALFTTGMISREAYRIRDLPSNFYMIGSMGLLTAVGAGLAMCSPRRRVIVVEGDGSALMSLGNFALVAHEGLSNLVHIVVDNESYRSTGGQPSITRTIDLAEVAKACGYRIVHKVAARDDFGSALLRCYRDPGPAFLLAKVVEATEDEAPRVDLEPPIITERLRRFIQDTSGATNLA